MIDPRLPDVTALALRAASMSVPALLYTMGHDFCFQSVTGQLQPLVSPIPERGEHLMDRPVPKPVKRRLLHHVLRALLGVPQRLALSAHGHNWHTMLEPVPDPTEPGRFLGVIGTCTLAQLPPPEDDLIGCYEVTGDMEGLHAGDLLTVRHRGAIFSHARIPQRLFDKAMLRHLLMPTCPETSDAGPTAAPAPCGSPSRRLCLA